MSSLIFLCMSNIFTESQENKQETPSPDETPTSTPMTEVAPVVEVEVKDTQEEAKVTEEEAKEAWDDEEDTKDAWDASSDEEDEEDAVAVKGEKAAILTLVQRVLS